MNNCRTRVARDRDIEPTLICNVPKVGVAVAMDNARTSPSLHSAGRNTEGTRAKAHAAEQIN